MRVAVLSAALCLAVGCASVQVEEGEGGPSPAFSGVWRGVFTTSAPGNSTREVAGALVLRAHGEVLEVRGLCQDGTGEATAGGEGSMVQWAGLVTCAVPSDACASATLRYFAGTFRLFGEGVQATLSVELYGGTRGCDAGEDVTVSFTGRR